MTVARSFSLVLIAVGCSTPMTADDPSPDEPAAASVAQAATGPLCAGDPNNPTHSGPVSARWICGGCSRAAPAPAPCSPGR